jgi:hypothetical protein
MAMAIIGRIGMRNSEDKIIRKRKHERGTILTVAIIVVVAMLIMTIPFLVRLSGQWRTTEKSYRSQAAFQLAEAGIDKMMWYLDPTTNVPASDTEAMQYSTDGTNDIYNISGIKTSDNRVIGNTQMVLTPPYGTDPQRRNLDSTGMVTFIAGNTVNRKVRVTLQKAPGSVFEVGFFVDKYFYIRNSFLLDAYDSRNGAYGGTNSLLTDVYFGSNSYTPDTNPNSPGDATWTIRSGGGSSDIYGTVMAGGDAAEAYNNGTATDPPDPSVLDEVISVPSEDIFKGTEDRLVMKQEYDLPPVDVYNLPPKEILGSIPPVGDWFPGYNATNPELSEGYYAERLNRAPLQTEIGQNAMGQSADRGTFSGSGTLTPANSGVYTSFNIGGVKTPGTLNISGGDVVIYVTSYGDSQTAASFYMGNSSSINIAPDSSLTLILGNTSVTVEQGYNINAQGSPPQALNCVILGTNQFAIPPTADLNFLDRGNLKPSDVDAARISGLMYFEHAQSDGNIYSAMYVPGAHITTGQGQNHMNFYGACLAGSMDFKVQIDFHYDTALGDFKLIPGGFEYWTIVNWQELVGG